MEIYLKRINETKTSTIGDLTFEGLHLCYILEDGYNFPKIAKVTRIPKGRYKLSLSTWGRHHEKYKKMYPEFHIGMIVVNDVPDFTGILFHGGTVVEDTDGCLLSGKKYLYNPTTDNYEVRNSQAAYCIAYKKIVDLMEAGEVYLNIS
jgi:hypothetical protein